MAPAPTGTASCMYRPRFRTSAAASRNFIAPAATRAEYSPRLCPATKSGWIPFASRTRKTAVDIVSIAGWVFSVSFSFSSGPSNERREIGKSKATSASAKATRASGNFSERSRPMPAYWEPCPGNRKATFMIDTLALGAKTEIRTTAAAVYDRRRSWNWQDRRRSFS